MKTQRYNKLVRDKIPDVIRKAGKNPITDTLAQESTIPALGAKLQEEV